MIGSYNKAYSRPVIVDEGQLRYLSNIIIERFDKVEYEIHTVDGASYKLPTFHPRNNYPWCYIRVDYALYYRVSLILGLNDSRRSF